MATAVAQAAAASNTVEQCSEISGGKFSPISIRHASSRYLLIRGVECCRDSQQTLPACSIAQDGAAISRSVLCSCTGCAHRCASAAVIMFILRKIATWNECGHHFHEECFTQEGSIRSAVAVLTAHEFSQCQSK